MNDDLAIYMFYMMFWLDDGMYVGLEYGKGMLIWDEFRELAADSLYLLKVELTTDQLLDVLLIAP